MELIPIQISAEGVLIPKAYLQDATEVEVQMTEHYVLIRPKIHTSNGKSTKQNGIKAEVKRRRFSFVGSGHTKNPQASLILEV
jgi:hypothetical protein